MRIADLLPEGAENAVSRRDLAAITGLDDRTLRRQIAAERRSGALIISSSGSRGGYYKPGTPEEIRRFAREMESRGRACMVAAQSAIRAIGD